LQAIELSAQQLHVHLKGQLVLGHQQALAVQADIVAVGPRDQARHFVH